MRLPHIFLVQLTRGLSTRSFLLSAAESGGWEFRDVMDDHTIHTTRYQDWHRVERAVSLINRNVERLQAEGWLLRRRSSAMGERTEDPLDQPRLQAATPVRS
jgi:hypothetical protein